MFKYYFYRTLWRLKQFPANISVTVVNGNYYDEQLPSALNKVSYSSMEKFMFPY